MGYVFSLFVHSIFTPVTFGFSILRRHFKGKYTCPHSFHGSFTLQAPEGALQWAAASTASTKLRIIWHHGIWMNFSIKLKSQSFKVSLLSSGGLIPSASTLHGQIDFRNIHFAYPLRTDAPIFSDLSLSVRAGSVTAVVGSSGSGKSTLGSLLLRYYDADQGNKVSSLGTA